MIRQPRQPSRPGGSYEYARQMGKHVQQKGASMAGGSTTTKGFIPNRQRAQKRGGSAPAPLVWAS